LKKIIWYKEALGPGLVDYPKNKLDEYTAKNPL
jgi:hypothetical protein